MNLTLSRTFPLFLVWFLGFLGLADSLFLTFNHYRLGGTPCTITSGCELVTTSAYSTIAGLPIALLGAGYYFTVLILAVLATFYAGQITKKAQLGLAYLTLTASLVSICLILVQAFILNAWCAYCLLSAFSTFTLFLASLMLVVKK